MAVRPAPDEGGERTLVQVTKAAQVTVRLFSPSPLRDTPRGPRSTGLVAGALSLVGAICFGVRLGQPTGVGALERLALWPAYLWLGLLDVALIARRLTPVPGARG